MHYSEWINKRNNISEVFEMDAVDSFRPKDGKWEPSLDGEGTYGSNWMYKFNVEGDPCGSEHNPCYAVKLGMSNKSANVSFYRNGSTEDTGRGVQRYVFMSVLKALSEFINNKKPEELHWGAVSKRRQNPVTGRVENERAREHIYEKWALRNLFPDKYIPITSQHWIRKDKYDTEYVSKGYPEISQELTDKAASGQMHVGEKARILTDLRERATAAEETIARREREEAERQRREAAERRAAELRVHIENPEKNPQGLRIGDTVDTHRSGLEGTGEITDFIVSDDRLLAKIRLTTVGTGAYYGVGDSVTYKVSLIDKETEERTSARAERHREREERRRREEEERTQEFVRSSHYNPHQLTVGDQVIYFDLYNSSGETSPNNSVGELVGWKRSYSGLHAKVKVSQEHLERTAQHFAVDDEGNILVSPKVLYKNTPENRAEIERKMQEIADDRRRREEEIRQREEERRRSQQAAIDQAIQDPEKNPYGIRVDDRVVHYPYLPNSVDSSGTHLLKGKVTAFDLQYGTLYAKVKMDDENRSSWTRDVETINPVQLVKDTPDAHQKAQEIVARHAAEERRSELTAREERRRNRVAGQAQQHQQIQSRAEATAALAADSARNPIGYKVGDHVEIVGGYRNRGRFGEIIDLKEDEYERNNIQAKVKIRGTRGDEIWFQLNWLRRDASERATVSTARRSRQAQRHQQLQAVLQVSNTSNFQVGENVTVTSGLNRNRTGQILRFATGSQNNVRATIVDRDGNQFTANLNNMQRVQAVA